MRGIQRVGFLKGATRSSRRSRTPAWPCDTQNYTPACQCHREMNLNAGMSLMRMKGPILTLAVEKRRDSSVTVWDSNQRRGSVPTN